jgi:hypothetical protein
MRSCFSGGTDVSTNRSSEIVVTILLSPERECTKRRR